MITSNTMKTSFRNSVGDIVLGIDLHEQWKQIDEDSAALHMLASAFLLDAPSNELTSRVYQCLGLNKVA